MYACNGILFNHESPRRGETFVTRKITRGLSNIAWLQGLENVFILVIWTFTRLGHAERLLCQNAMVNAATRATGRLCYCNRRPIPVRQFVDFAASELGIKITL